MLRWVSGILGRFSRASNRKRTTESWESWREADYEVRRCKRRRGAWLRDKDGSKNNT